MNDSDKTREQLLEELRLLRQQLEGPEPAAHPTGLVPGDFSWLLDQALHPITVYDRDAVILFVNTVGARNLGHPRDEILGRPLRDFLPETHEVAAGRNHDVLEADQPLFFEDTLELPTGTRTFFSVLQPVSRRGQKVVLVNSYDITDRKQAEDAARFTADLLDHVEQAVIATDVDARVIYVNRFAQRLHGRSAEEMLGRDTSWLVSPEHQSVREKLRADVMSGGSWSGEIEVVHKDGTRFPAHVMASPVRDGSGRVVGTVAVSYDLTEKKRLDAELRRVANLESLGVLAGGIAHDFNNILVGVVGNLSLIESLEPGSTEIPEVAREALAAAQRSQRLANQLLTFARGGTPVRRPTRLGDLVRLAAEHALGEGLRRVDFAVPDDLPLVDADRDQLGQVVQNLVLNADQAMRGAGGMRVAASALDLGEGEVPSLPAGAYVVLRVEDEGPGIPADVLGRVFDPYFTTRQAGHGLGLAICHSIVAKHDGHIAVESGPGRGAVFTVYLPALPPGSPQESDRGSDAAAGARAGDRGRVLLFEDEGVVARAMVRMLSHLGYDAEVASSADDTLALFDTARESGRRFDAVITDLTVPDGRGGKEIVGELKRRESRIPVVLATGYGNDPVVAAHRDHGFDACLVKPITVRELGRVLRQLLEGRGPAGA